MFVSFLYFTCFLYFRFLHIMSLSSHPYMFFRCFCVIVCDLLCFASVFPGISVYLLIVCFMCFPVLSFLCFILITCRCIASRLVLCAFLCYTCSFLFCYVLFCCFFLWFRSLSVLLFSFLDMPCLVLSCLDLLCSDILVSCPFCVSLVFSCIVVSCLAF